MASIEKVSILIVDDKPANLLALEAILDSPAYDLVRASSGEEALKLVETRTFGTILLDVQMPGIDGYETARRIKKLANGRDVPIVFVTAVYQESEDARRGYEAGGLDYFPKPLDPVLLKTKVKLYCDLHLLTRAPRKVLDLAERKLEAVLRTISEGVVVVDTEGRVVQFNDEAKRIWGSPEAMPFGRRSEYVGAHPETGEMIASGEWPLVRVLKTGQATGSELTEIEVPGRGDKLLLISSACPLRTDEGELLGAVAAFKVLPPAPRHYPRGEGARMPPWSHPS